MTHKDPLLPDTIFYSAYGRYVSFLLQGYDKESFSSGMVPKEAEERAIFLGAVQKEKGKFPAPVNDAYLWLYIIGAIFLIFGYFPLGARIFNICLSIASAFFLFKVARRQFGELTANLFLLVALFLPTQFGYSITLSRDFIRVFLVSFTLWVIYGGALCLKRQRQ